MKRRRDLLIANGAALLLLAVVLLVGWRQEAAFGLGVLVVMDAIVLVRERPWLKRDEKTDETELEAGDEERPT